MSHLSDLIFLIVTLKIIYLPPTLFSPAKSVKSGINPEGTSQFRPPTVHVLQGHV